LNSQLGSTGAKKPIKIRKIAKKMKTKLPRKKTFVESFLCMKELLR